MTNIQDEPAYSKNVLEFITVAHEYCLFMEDIEKYPTRSAMGFLLKISPLLYLKATLLPPVEVEDESANERFLTEENYEQIFNAVRARFREFDKYWFVDPDGSDEYPVAASLSEDLTDVYQDLKDFILLYQKNTRAAKQNAVRSCYEYFQNEWGIKLLRILKTLHSLYYN